MKIAICDDEIYWGNEISKKINSIKHEGIELEIDCFTNQDDLLKKINEVKYNLVYLDIEMPGINGIKAAQMIKRVNPICIIIFVTAYDCYIQEAFRVEAFQYLKKPIDDKLFKEEYERAVQLYKKTNLVKIFKVKEGYKAFHLSEIISLESYYNSTLIKTIRGTYSTNYVNMRKIKKEIMDYDFLQLQSGYIVNMHYILGMKYREAELITGQTLPISMTNYTKVQEKYHKFIETLK